MTGSHSGFKHHQHVHSFAGASHVQYQGHSNSGLGSNLNKSKSVSTPSMNILDAQNQLKSTQSSSSMKPRKDHGAGMLALYM